MTKSLGAAGIAAAALAFLATSRPAVAGGKWDKEHPRRAEVNGRLANQNKRIAQGEKSGRISKQQGAQLHAEHQNIRSQERADGAAHGGHITKGEQRQLNHEENAESKQIDDEKH
jgi:hypothetical protein